MASVILFFKIPSSLLSFMESLPGFIDLPAI